MPPQAIRARCVRCRYIHCSVTLLPSYKGSPTGEAVEMHPPARSVHKKAHRGAVCFFYAFSRKLTDSGMRRWRQRPSYPHP